MQPERVQNLHTLRGSWVSPAWLAADQRGAITEERFRVDKCYLCSTRLLNPSPTATPLP